MLTDPQVVTFNSVAKTLARISQSPNGTVYATSDGEFKMSILSKPSAAGTMRVEILLTHNYPDGTPDPFSGGPASQPNSFGLVYEVNSNMFYSSTEIPLLRTALLALVDSTFQGKLLGGEK